MSTTTPALRRSAFVARNGVRFGVADGKLAEALGRSLGGAPAGGWCGGWLRLGDAALQYSVRLLPGTARLHPDDIRYGARRRPRGRTSSDSLACRSCSLVWQRGDVVARAGAARARGAAQQRVRAAAARDAVRRAPRRRRALRREQSPSLRVSPAVADFGQPRVQRVTLVASR